MPTSNPFAAPTGDVHEPRPNAVRIVPALHIWRHPRATIRWLLDHRPGHGTLVLPALLGVAHTLDAVPSMLDPTTIALVVVAFVLNGWITTLLAAAIMTWLGKRRNGTGDYRGVLTAYCWGAAPSTLHLVVLPLLALDLHALDRRLLFVGAVVYGLWSLTLTLWTLVWQSLAMAEAHGFGLAQGFSTVFIPRLGWWFGRGLVAAALISARLPG